MPDELTLWPSSSADVASATIDLRDDAHPRTRVRVDPRDTPFTRLSPVERKRLLVRVLCELVAYGELDGPDLNEIEAQAASALGTSETPTR